VLVAHALLVSLTIHERRFTRKSSESAIAAEMFMNNADSFERLPDMAHARMLSPLTLFAHSIGSVS
jgi:hypothetical protein